MIEQLTKGRTASMKEIMNKCKYSSISISIEYLELHMLLVLKYKLYQILLEKS